MRLYRKPEQRRFLSTPSARRATAALVVLGGMFDISIHALREEGDRFCQPAFLIYF